MRRSAATFHAKGQLNQAAEAYREVLAAFPDDPQTLLLLGVVQGQQGDFGLAVETMQKVLRLDPAHGIARVTLGRALRGLGKIDEALVEFDQVLAHSPADKEALFAKASTLLEHGRPAEAVTVYDRLVEVDPKHLAAWLNRGSALTVLGDLQAALACFERARQINPTVPEHHLREGQTLLALNRDQDAREAFDRAVQINPNLPAAHLGRAAALMKRHNVVSALVSADRARQLQPDNAEAYCLIGCGQIELGNLDDAVNFLSEAIRLRPNYPEAHFALGDTLHELGRHDEAVQSFARVVELKPSMPLAQGNLLHSKMRACDWNGLDELSHNVIQSLEAGVLAINPFALQAICDNEATLRKCAEMTSEHFHPRANRIVAKQRQRGSGKIRIGYLSGEFREHATAILMSGVWDHHDKSAFEIIGIDAGFDDQSPRRQRIEAAFDRMVKITDLSDSDAALRIAALEVDVLINLNGFFGKARPGVFAFRPAPVQVNYLGFPGTLGADYFDYLLADDTVIPPAAATHYREKVVYLPGCYQPNDNSRPISTEPQTRQGNGLPEQAFVFCCFNNVYKITPKIFGVWMDILKAVPGSVLWLLESSTAVQNRLRSTAESLGVDAARLVFAAPVDGPLHLARHRLADLFLDTSPYNAHTTASDALWSGLPILTVAGKSFAGRVAESLLRSVGLDELVAADLDQYRKLAVSLAGDPTTLKTTRARLEAARTSAGVFNTVQTTRALENAFRYMVERSEAGLLPAGTHIPINTH
jgi:predicted O-linked N-acetylglucosamine transferase (SPINDLY family)